MCRLLVRTAQVEDRIQVHNKLFRTVRIMIYIIFVAIDWKAFEAECKKIVHEISDRFIDLGLDDHESDYAANEL